MLWFLIFLFLWLILGGRDTYKLVEVSDSALLKDLVEIKILFIIAVRHLIIREAHRVSWVHILTHNLWGLIICVASICVSIILFRCKFWRSLSKLSLSLFFFT
jgi:hypothetical protein